MSHDETRENVLYAFAIESNHNRATLDRYLKKYPQFTNELIDLSSELRLQANSPQPSETPIDDPGFDEAWATFSSIAPCATPAINPFARFQGRDFAELCVSLLLPRSVVSALRDRLVEPASIPPRLVSAIARLTDVENNVVQQYLAQSPVTPVTVAFKAKKKPVEIEQTSFKQLIERTELTEEQHKSVTEYCEDD